jgi:hypothetical protein
VAAVKAERTRRQAAEADNQRLREQNAYYQGLQASTPAPATTSAAHVPAGPPAAPQVEDFESFEAFQVADRQHIIDTATHNAEQRFEQQQAARWQQEQAAATTRTFQERLTKAAELDPDLPVIASTFHLQGPNYIPLSGAMQDAIRESDVGPQLLRYFANNRPEATRLASLSPTSALREVGRIEASIINKPIPPVKHVTSAPNPVKPVGSFASGDVDEDKLPMSEYIARERGRIDARRTSQRR